MTGTDDPRSSKSGEDSSAKRTRSRSDVSAQATTTTTLRNHYTNTMSYARKQHKDGGGGPR